MVFGKATTGELSKPKSGTWSGRYKKIAIKVVWSTVREDLSRHIQGEVVPSVFSERGLRMTASWPVILRPRARSTFAPRASLFRLSDFSAVGTNRCLVSGLFSRRSNPSWRWEMSAIRGSPLGRSEASEGLPLTVENRLELRFCGRLAMRWTHGLAEVPRGRILPNGP